jgi:hypothetical protein
MLGVRSAYVTHTGGATTKKGRKKRLQARKSTGVRVNANRVYGHKFIGSPRNQNSVKMLVCTTSWLYFQHDYAISYIVYRLVPFTSYHNSAYSNINTQ